LPELTPSSSILLEVSALKTQICRTLETGRLRKRSKKHRQTDLFASLNAPLDLVVQYFGSTFRKTRNQLYESIAAIDLGTETALTLYNGKEFEEMINPRFIRKA